MLILIKLHGVSRMTESRRYSVKYSRKRSSKHRGKRTGRYARTRHRFDGAHGWLQRREGIKGTQDKILSDIPGSVNRVLVQSSLYDALVSGAASSARFFQLGYGIRMVIPLTGKRAWLSLADAPKVIRTQCT